MHNVGKDSGGGFGEILGRELYLKPDSASAYHDLIVGQSGLVDEDRVLLFHSHSRTSAPDVAGDGEQVLYVNHGERFLGSLMSCLFQIQFAVYGNRKYKIAIGGDLL